MNGNNEIDDLLKLSSLQDIQIPEKVENRIDETLKKCKKKKPNFVLYFGRVIATIATGLTIAAGGLVAYAGATGKLDINIGNTGHKKIDQNYNEVATSVDKKIDNEYFTLTLESMAADQAYLIFDYDIKFKEKAMQEIGEFKYDIEDEHYGIWLNSDTFINGEEKVLVGGRNLSTVEKISENEFKLVEVYSIANMKENTLQVRKKFNSLQVIERKEKFFRETKLNVDIAQELTATVKFENRDTKVLVEKEFEDGSKLYVEQMANSKFENFILVRNISAPQKYKDMWNREAEFMMSFPQFAICNQDDETIYSDSNRLDEYYEKMVEDGSFEYTEPIDINEDDIVRMQEVNLLKLGIEEENIPEQIKLLPITAKLYNDRNMSEYNFYMQEDWYPVTVGDVHIEETSQIGGSVTVTKIEESDDDITFYYEKNGYVPEFIYLEVRVKNDKLNYYSPFETEIKGIDGEENKFVFTKDVEKMTGAPLVGYERTNNASELEFALFYNVKYEILAEPLTFEWEKTENSEVATIENIEFSEFVNDINESLHDMNVAQNYSGIITEMSDKTLKFYSDIFKKDLILSYPAEFEYTNKRTNQKLEFKDIKVGDYLMFERVNGGNFDEGQFMVIRNLKGEALKEELLLQMNPYAERLGVEFVYREAKNVEIVDENNAIITYEFSDMYQFRLGNSEKFEIKVLVNSDTKICRDATWDWEPIQIRDLETIEYEPARVMICLNQATINDEMPVAESVELGFPAEEF